MPCRAGDVDVTVNSDLVTMHKVWLGSLPLDDARRAGRLEFGGDPALVRRMPSVFELSPMAETVQAAGRP